MRWNLYKDCIPVLAETSRPLIKTDFLVPFIKSTLEEMISSESGKKLFSRADNLNSLFVNTEADKLLRNNLNYNFPNQSFRSSKNTNLQDSIFNAFINNDYFLLVNENTLQDKIEFQLTVYRVIKDTASEHYDFPIKNIIKPLSENDFFIDVTSTNYLSTLKNGIKNLFPESNFVTNFHLDLTGNVYPTSLNTYNVGKNDTLTLNISDIYDEDTPIDEIKFLFQIKNLERNNNPSSFFIATKGKQSKIVFKNSGNFEILVHADDGSYNVVPKIINIRAFDMPQIIAVKNHFNIIHQLSHLGNDKITIQVPMVLKNYNSTYPFNFVVLNQIKDEHLKKVFVDSVVMVLKQNHSKKFNSNFFKQRDSTYISKIRRIDSNFYLIDVVVNSSNRVNTFYIYGFVNNLKTNNEIINVNVIQESSLHNEIALQYGSLKLGNTDCLCGSDSTEKINYIKISPLSVDLSVFAYKGISVGVMENTTFILSQNMTFGKYPILKSKNLFTTIDFGVFASSSFMLQSWYSNIRVKYYNRKTFNGFDTTYKDLRLFNLGYQGISFEASFFPMRNPTVGISFGVNVVDSKFKFIVIKEVEYRFGLAVRLTDL